MPTSFYADGTPAMSLAEAAALQARRQRLASQEADGIAPPGWTPSLPRLAKAGITQPAAVAWWLHRQGTRPALHATAPDASFDASVTQAAAYLRTSALPREYPAAARGESWAQTLLLSATAPLRLR